MAAIIADSLMDLAANLDDSVDTVCIESQEIDHNLFNSLPYVVEETIENINQSKSPGENDLKIVEEGCDIQLRFEVKPPESILGGEIILGRRFRHFKNAKIVVFYPDSTLPGDKYIYELVWSTLHELLHWYCIDHDTLPGNLMYPELISYNYDIDIKEQIKMAFTNLPRFC